MSSPRPIAAAEHVPVGAARPGRPATRREFLARIGIGGAGLVAAATFSGCAHRETPDTSAGTSGAGRSLPPLRLSTSSIHFHRLPIEDACDRISKLGFEAIDIWSAYQGCPHLDDVAARLGPDGLRALLERSKLKLFAFSVYVGGFPAYAELLGRSGGGVAIRGSAGPCAPGDVVPRMKAFLEELKPEADLAEKNGCRLAIENHGQSLLDSLDSFKAFVDLNRNPRVGIALAPYHLQAGGVPVEETIAVCGKRLLFFYAWQHAEGLGQLPGHGPTDFAPWIAALDKAGYEGYLNVFLHADIDPGTMEAALAKSRDYLLERHAAAFKA